MNLSQLINGLPVEDRNPGLDPEVIGITYDSRKVEKGFLFVALKGQLHNGAHFIPQAINQGCVAILVEDEIEVPPQVALLLTKNARVAMAHIARKLYAYPDQILKVIGITGTNGKTTTTTLIQQILSLSGKPCALIGTVQNISGGIRSESIRTTPESTDFLSLLKESACKGDKYASVEVSSIGIEMSRVEGVRFAIGAFTNLTHDHLDFHGDMETYFRAKSRLMEQSDKFIVNADDPYGQRIKAMGNYTISVGIDEASDYRISRIHLSPTYTEFYLHTPDDSFFFKSPLLGLFNVYNLAFALVVSAELGLSLSSLQPIIDQLVGAQGRFEKIKINTSQPFGVVVDYAHTPDALEKICTEGKKLIGSGSRLHVLFGCGGNRDRTKRSEMAMIVSKYADVIWHTSDNPRDESVDSIFQDAVAGISVTKLNNPSLYHQIADRSQAVELAIKDLRHGDLLILAGKGHENYQEIKGIKYPYNDRECAEYNLEKRL